LQSIYWVLTWACHRRCVHCYDDRFRPYAAAALARLVEEGRRAHPRILANLPDDPTWLNERTGQRERTQVTLAGGELLIDGVLDELFFPLLAGIRDRWGSAGPTIAMQTTGDVLTAERLDALLARGVAAIAIASVDDYHAGMQGERKFRFMERVRALMASRGVREVSLGIEKHSRLRAGARAEPPPGVGPTYLFFGAQPELWIGELWPRGRALQNGLSHADYTTNFCARWSGGKDFLRIGRAGSEVAIEPDGSVYPCCLKTRAPLGNLTEERLEDVLASVATLPALQAIDRGEPEAMGAHDGWSQETFRARSAIRDGAGRLIENRCIGCDQYFVERLGAQLEALRAARLAARTPGTPGCHRDCRRAGYGST
jgi:hypothetical protein